MERPEKEPLLTDMFRIIANVLNEQTITQVLPQEQTQKVYEILRNQSTLLIVDNMETLLEEERRKMLSFLNNVPITTQVIITTRDFLGFDDISIQSLTEKEGYDLLDRQARLKRIAPDEDWADWRKKIYDRFSGVPTALIYAMGQKAAGKSFANIIDPNTNITTDLCKFCFDSSVAPLQGGESYHLLLAMTLFEDSVCRDALIRVAGLVEGTQAASRAVAELQRLSLIIENSGRYSILSLTREYASLELGKEENSEFKSVARGRLYNWYLEFTTEYGGDDWVGWRAKHNRLDAEWKNIESVLNWYANRDEWERVLRIWQNVDNYADLTGYWQDRRYWWALLGRNLNSVETRVKALSEKGFTLTLMGTEHLGMAEDYLGKSWDSCQAGDNFLQATVANHQAVLAKVRGDYQRAHKWLDREIELLQPERSDSQWKRYLARNKFYRMEVFYLENNLELAREGFEQVITLTQEIGWKRFKNYAKNTLADIYIKLNNLVEAERLLKGGLESATEAKETRRIALYESSYARFYFQSALNAENNGSYEESIKHLNNAQEYATNALKTLNKELMIAEKDEITALIESIKRKLVNYQSEQQTAASNI
jgi:tetratricopeptide (TPR) repeat protein